jgi:tetratricopeptide (TPR) repeat protein
MVDMTTVRRAVLTVSAAPLGPDNPLPALRLLGGTPTPAVDARDRAGLPRDMARQLGHAPLRTLLPTRVRDGYGRDRTPTDLDTIVIENDRLRVTVLPGLGGRVHSLLHKPTGRDLVYRNPVLQPAAFALNGAWFSGGIEWNIGAHGHGPLSCAPLHAAVVPAPDGGPMLRLWEWERLRDLPFQVDLWLPDGAEHLRVAVRIRNPHARAVPCSWWSNTAVPEDRRVLAPADSAWHFGYERALRRVPVPRSADGADHTYPLRSAHAADYFYALADGRRRWIAALGEDGTGLVQTSTDTLLGRKLFLWGTARGSRRWQEWLTEPGTPGYAEIQAGLARTQLEHPPLEAGEEVSWLEVYGPLGADPAAVHGADWAAAGASVEDALERILPRAEVDAAYARWRAHAADTEPGPLLATGSGWGALEVLRDAHALPGTPFPPELLGEEQRPWAELLRTGGLPDAPESETARWTTPVNDAWRDLLESAAPAGPSTEYHLGIAQWAAGDLAQAVRSWERGLKNATERWPLLYCLAVADRESGHPVRAAERFAEAYDAQRRTGDPLVSAALAREAVPALLAAHRADRARRILDGLPEEVRARGAFRYLAVRLLLAEGRQDEARAVFDAGFEVADLREGAEELGETWARITDEPLPDAYEFRMRPPE